jgi:thiol-disulfide isomerase/thioredoxin
MKIIHVNSEKDLNKFNKTIKKGKMMVVFVADWCGHCQHLKPIWKKMERVMKKTNCAKSSMLVMVYSDYRERVNIPHNCNGYPTIRLYKDGKILNDWGGDWRKKGLLVKSAKKFFRSSGTKKRSSKKGTKRRRKPKRRNSNTRKKRRRRR